MARLQENLLVRTETFCDRVLDVVEALEEKQVHPRILGQMAAAGTSVGANAFEADEAMSRPDFCKCLGICAKELNECRFWIRLIGRRGWLTAKQLSMLESECDQLRRIFGAMISRTRMKAAAAKR